MEFSIIRGLLALFCYQWHGSTPCGPAQTVAGHCVRRKRGQNKVAMNTVTAELVAVEIVIVLGAVILLGNITVVWAMFWPSAHL